MCPSGELYTIRQAIPMLSHKKGNEKGTISPWKWLKLHSFEVQVRSTPNYPSAELQLLLWPQIIGVGEWFSTISSTVRRPSFCTIWIPSRSVSCVKRNNNVLSTPSSNPPDWFDFARLLLVTPGNVWSECFYLIFPSPLQAPAVPGGEDRLIIHPDTSTLRWPIHSNLLGNSFYLSWQRPTIPLGYQPNHL